MNIRCVVINRKGEELPGYMLRAGDKIVGIHYDHGEKLVAIYIGPRVGFWRFVWERLRGKSR
jgi:hypothetical protein